MSFWFHRLDKITNENISEFLPWIFFYLPGGFLEAFWGFLQASLFMILHTKSPGSPKSFHEAPRKLQKNSGQKSRNNFVGIFVQTMKPKGHFEINWPLSKVTITCLILLVVFTFVNINLHILLLMYFFLKLLMFSPAFNKRNLICNTILKDFRNVFRAWLSICHN